MAFLRKLYQATAKRIYAVGKQAYEKEYAALQFKRGIVDSTTHFHTGAEIINLSGNRQQIVIGKGCQIAGMLLVYSYGGQIQIGDFCSLSPGSRIVSAKKIAIGNRVLIGHNVNIIDNISHPLDAALRHQDYMSSYSTGMKEYDIKSEPIIIEDDVWIGFNVTIMRGVKIGQGAIIGSNSVVTKDVSPWSVNVGNPLRITRQLTPIKVED